MCRIPGVHGNDIYLQYFTVTGRVNLKPAYIEHIITCVHVITYISCSCHTSGVGHHLMKQDMGVNKMWLEILNNFVSISHNYNWYYDYNIW